MKILILKPSSLGDVVQALPVLRLLKLHDPTHQIFWWISTELLPLLKDDPDLSGVFPFDRRRWARPGQWRALFESIRSLRERRFDWVVDLQGLARSGLFAWLARGKLMIGVDDPREGAHGFYDLIVPRPSFHTHAVDWYLEVLREMGVPVHWNFDWLPPRNEAARRVRETWNPAPGRWVMVNPGARWLNKRWPAERYRELVRQITAAFPDIRIAILGGKEDAPLGAVVTQANPQRCLDLTGQTSLAEMIEWIRLAELVITNDSGPMHIAAALRKPVVAIFGPTEPRRTGPYQQIEHAIRVPLPCSPCLKSTCANDQRLECLHAIQPAAVFTQVERRLAQVGIQRKDQRRDS